MDLNKILKSINSFDEYVLSSHDAENKYRGSKVQFNMSTVLALKKIRSYEIEYFNKFEENGFACVIFEYILNLPPSKSWCMLGKELVSLLQYWLDAIRKYFLVSHSEHWWIFLKRLLKYIEGICPNDSSLPNLLVEHTAECLLDLAGNDRADIYQKLEILHCLNSYCAESSREIRLAMKSKFGDYFIKLSGLLVSCGYFPWQLAALETLVRWMVPRHEHAARAAAAAQWWRCAPCPPHARHLFLSRPWLNFYKDSRDFLNAVNEPGDLITSVICRKLLIGTVVVITGTETQQTWLDVNTPGRCLSVVLPGGVARRLGGGAARATETLLVTDRDTLNASLYRESAQLIISVKTSSPPHGPLAAIKMTGDGNQVKITVSSTGDVKRLDKALRSVFGDKYQLLTDLDNVSPSGSKSIKINRQPSEEDTRFSFPAQARRRRHSGYIVRSKQPVAWNSPSSASTSSLAVLHEKLAALPRFEYYKNSGVVCLKPELSSVTEVTETDETCNLSSAFTPQFARYGVCYRNIKIKEDNNRKFQSDGEVKNPPKSKQLSPISGDHSASCLLVATIGSADESVINDTIERISKSKDYNSDNIVDLLVQEALYSLEVEQGDKSVHSGIKAENNNHSPELNRKSIENTPFANADKVVSRKSLNEKSNCTVISKSTSSDESNLEVVSDSPVNYVNARRKKLSIRRSVNKKPLQNDVAESHRIDVSHVDNSTENSVRDVIISPTIAKKLNKSSSEISETLEERSSYITENNPIKKFDDNDVIDCLDGVVNQVCDDINKYTDKLNRDDNILIMVNKNKFDVPSTSINCENRVNDDDNKKKSKQKDPKQKKGIKLNFKRTVKREKAVKLENKLKTKNKPVTSEDDNIQDIDVIHSSPLETSFKIKSKKGMNKESPRFLEMGIDTNTIGIGARVQENNAQRYKLVESSEIKKDSKDKCNETEFVTPSLRRKRKLYSPKEEQTHNEQPNFQCTNVEMNDIILSELKSTNISTPKSVATCYKQLESERRKYIRKPRNRKSKTKLPDPISPRTLKMNQDFEKLKGTIENDEKIKIANKTSTGLEVYNFSSSSDDQDFKENKKINSQTKMSTTLNSYKSQISTKHERVAKLVDYGDIVGKKSAKTKSKRVVKKKTNSKIVTKPSIDLVDERMRQVTAEVLNTSLVVQKPIDITNNELELVLDNAPESEYIADDNLETDKNDEIIMKTVKKIKSLPQKKEKITKGKSLNVDITEDRTESPLPGLVVESVIMHTNDPNDSVTANMLQKFKKIYQGSDAYINETNTTQNLLSDAEKVTYSPEKRNNSCYMSDSTSIEVDNLSNKTSKKSTKNKQTRRFRLKLIRNVSNIKNTNTNVSETEKMSNDTKNISHSYEAQSGLSEKSIQTYDITAHGDLDELPPNPEMLDKYIEPRDLEFEDLNQSMRDYFSKLATKLNAMNRETSNSSDYNVNHIDKNGNNSPSLKDSSAVVIAPTSALEEVAVANSDQYQICTKIKDTTSKQKTLKVSVERLSLSEINKWLPSHNNSISNQNSGNSDICHINTKNRDTTNIEKNSIVSVERLSFSDMHKKFPSQNNSISDQNSDKFDTCPINTKKPDTSSKEKSPIVSEKRVSLSEMHNSVPPQNNLNSDQNSDKSDICHINIKKRDTTSKEKSPVVSVKRLSLSEVQKWVTSRRISSTSRLSQEIRGNVVEKGIKSNKTYVNNEDSGNACVNLNKSFIVNENKKPKVKPAIDKPDNKLCTGSLQNSRSHEADKEPAVKPKSSSEKSVNDEENYNKSLIFLIEIDGLTSNNEKKREALQSNDNIKRVRSRLESTKTKVEMSSQRKKSPEKQPLKRDSKSSPISFEIGVSSPESTSTRVFSSRHRLKRKSSTLKEVKKQKTECTTKFDTVTIANSGASIASVNDWFRRNERTTDKDNSMRLTLIDLVQNVTQKLDTTLDGINKNTSKMLVNLFVDAQKQLDKQKQERQDMYRQITSNILRDIMKLVNDKFADYETRSQEMETDFMEQLRKRASQVLLKDAQQKQIMIQIMMADVQAATDHINNIKK